MSNLDPTHRTTLDGGHIQMDFFPEKPSGKQSKMAGRTGSFTDNMRLPVHRWFRYSAGFSAEWAEQVLAKANFERNALVFDPFAGSGTTLLAAQCMGLRSAGLEQHGFVYRVAKAKLLWSGSERSFLEDAKAVLERAHDLVTSVPLPQSELLRRCYDPEALPRLEALKVAYAEFQERSHCAELLWLLLTSILRECSGVGTAQWQYLLPNKSKARVSDPFLAFAERARMFCGDMVQMNSRATRPTEPMLLNADARTSDGLDRFAGEVQFVLTSPPYPNNYDYADATRLEMTFWGEVQRWGDLHGAVRKHLVRSCSQHTAAEKLELDMLLDQKTVAPIREELTEVCRSLATVRETKGGKKTYHTMVAAYFHDLAQVWQMLRRVCADGAKVCFVVGDSAPYGVYVPVEKWLGILALAAGFHSFSFEKNRDRNVKWKNRKHRVPLKEGNLWVDG